jgi:hypothetical protein
MVTVLNALTPLDWFKLGSALLLFIGPGLALISWTPVRRTYDVTQTLIVALCLSIAAWAVLLAWLQMAGLQLNSAMVLLVLAGGWAIALARYRGEDFLARPLARAWGNANRILLWSVVLASMLLSLWAIQGIAVGSNLDSYHHTLIAQMIIERGGLPTSYEPYVPLATFSYHFGFHAFVGALGMLTGIRAVSLMPIVGQLLIGGTALGIAFLVEVLFEDQRVAVAAAALTGLVAPVPAAFGSYGRYPQLAGLMLLAVLIAIAYYWSMRSCDIALSPIPVVLGAGLVLTHYRVTIMAACGVALFVPFGLASTSAVGKSARDWLAIGSRAAVVAIAAFLLTLPWIWHVISSRGIGYPLNFAGASTDAASFFDLNRLGPWVLDHPYTTPLLALTLCGIITALWRHERRVILLAAWSAALLLLSMPRLLGQYLDPVTVTMSLFVQGSIVCGWLVVEAAASLRRVSCVLGWAVWCVLALACADGLSQNASALQPAAMFVAKDDLDAVSWIRTNTPESAVFAINLFHFEFNDRAVAGSDAGGWLPLLARRQTISLPLSSSIERAASSDVLDNTVTLERLHGRLTTPEGLAALERLGATYVYIGVRGGPIVAAELLASPAFRLEFQSGTAYVFRIVGAP